MANRLVTEFSLLLEDSAEEADEAAAAGFIEAIIVSSISSGFKLVHWTGIPWPLTDNRLNVRDVTRKRCELTESKPAHKDRAVWSPPKSSPVE